jgi:hypothetical protein
MKLKKLPALLGLVIGCAHMFLPGVVVAQDRAYVVQEGTSGQTGQQTRSSLDNRTVITNPPPIEGCNSGLRWSAGAGRYWCPGVVADPSPPPPPPAYSPPPSYVYTPPPPYDPPTSYVYTPPPPYDPPPSYVYTPPPPYDPPPSYVYTPPPPPAYDPPTYVSYTPPPPPAYDPPTYVYYPPPPPPPAPAPWVLPVFGPSDSGANGYVVIDYYTGQVTGTIGDNGVFTPPYAGGTADR